MNDRIFLHGDRLDTGEHGLSMYYCSRCELFCEASHFMRCPCRERLHLGEWVSDDDHARLHGEERGWRMAPARLRAAVDLNALNLFRAAVDA
jgi:hypothetical protein